MTNAFPPSLSSKLPTPNTSRLSGTTSDGLEQEQNGVKLGFIGCGTIASAIATGLLTQDQINISSVALSRRSESKSKALVEKFGDDVIQVSDDNQFIVDNCDIIFLCVLPQQEEQVLSQLKISEEKTLVSLVVRVDDFFLRFFSFLGACFILSFTNNNFILCIHFFH